MLKVRKRKVTERKTEIERKRERKRKVERNGSY